jgi:two-component system invasion response regulator UvrY
MDVSKIKIALVDDHALFRKGITELINNFKDYTVIWDVNNGKEAQEKILHETIPTIIIIDIKMPVMDGYETSAWIKQNFPQISILCLSMYEDERTIIKMLRSGASGYILKDAEPLELLMALEDMRNKGVYFSKYVGQLLISANNPTSQIKKSEKPLMNERELEFIKLACSELTYKEIADIMHVALRTVDGYREALFEKLNVKNRVGLVLYAIKNNIFSI